MRKAEAQSSVTSSGKQPVSSRAEVQGSDLLALAPVPVLLPTPHHLPLALAAHHCVPSHLLHLSRGLASEYDLKGQPLAREYLPMCSAHPLWLGAARHPEM